MSLVPIYEPYLPLKYKLAVAKQVMSGWIGPGERVTEFEHLLSGVHGGLECVATGSGTQALMLAYLALDLPQGALVLCPDYGFPACQNAARLLGYRVGLVDIDPFTGCMSPAALQAKIIGASAVVHVDHCGYTGNDLQRVSTICATAGVPLVEDAAVAVGCNKAGHTGAVSILSFSVPKVVTCGQGGAVMTKSPKIAAKLRQLVDQGGGDWRKTRVHSAIGGNFRMTDIQAALGSAQVNDLDSILEKRTEVWRHYRERIALACDVYPSGWMVTYRARSAGHAQLIIEAVRSAGFDAKRLYCPVHRNDPYAADDALYPGANEFFERTVYLPSSITLSRSQIDKICKAIKHSS